MKTLLLAIGVILLIPFESEAQEEPPHGMDELQAYSVFVDAYRGDDYELAVQYGEWMIEAAPRELSGHSGFSLERHFTRMMNVYINMGEEESDPSLKEEHFGNAERIIKKAFETFSEDEVDYYEWYLRQGRFYHENREHLDATMDDAIEAYQKLYEIDSQRFAEEGDGFFARVVLTELSNNGDRDEAFAMIEQVEPYAGVELQETISEVRDNLFENPEERIEFIESRLADAEGAEREEMLLNLVNLYDETGQGDKATETAIELYEINSNFENTRAVADIFLSEGNYSEAVTYLSEAMELSDSNRERKEIALELSESHQQLDQLEEARSYAEQAISMDESYGEAYMRISSIYANTISNCTGGGTLDREDRAVYWLVLDYLDKAKQADPSLASTADNRAESYEGAMPSSEDKFFSGWEEGDSFQINGDLKDCYAWVNESTTVR